VRRRPPTTPSSSPAARIGWAFFDVEALDGNHRRCRPQGKLPARGRLGTSVIAALGRTRSPKNRVVGVLATRVPSMGPGSRPRESNFCCLPGRAGGTPILVEGVLRERFGLTHVNLDTGWAVSPRRHMPCIHQDSRLEQLLTELGCPHDIALSDSPSFAHRTGELIARSAIKQRSHPDAKNRPPMVLREIKRDFDVSLQSVREDTRWMWNCLRSGTLGQELIKAIRARLTR
jgi:hypothetical protein